MNNWTISIKPWNSIIVLFCLLVMLPQRTSSDCGPGANPGFQGYTFLISTILDPQAPASFLPRFESLYEEFGKQEIVQPEDNVREWWERYCEIPIPADIKSIIYKTNLDDLRRLAVATREEGIYLSPRLASNSFAVYLKNNGCTETANYLVFAKQCEPHVIPKMPWDDSPRNISAMKRLIRAGKEDFINIKSHYIRLRYAYQLIRLAHYSGDYQGVLDLYDYCMPKTDNEPSIIDYWIMGHKAGALKGLNRRVEAAYLFSKVFQNCASKRESAFQSFYIKTDEEWEACIKMCKTDQERATLHVLRAYEDKSRAIEEMQKIYAYSPLDRNLEPLMVNEIKEMEKNLLGVEFNDYRRLNKRVYGYPKDYAGEYIIALTNFCKRLADEKQVERPAFWRMAQGYLEMIKGDNYAAQLTFAIVSEEVNNPILKEQLRVFQVALDINSLSYLDYQENPDRVERAIAEIQSAGNIFDRYRYFPDFLRDKLSYLYDKAGNKGKAFIVQFDIEDLKPNPRPEILDSLIAITRDENKTTVERQMLEQSGEENTIEYDLMDMKATMLLSDFNIAGALEEYKLMDDRARWRDYGVFRPFHERFGECIYCPIPDTLEAFTKGELLERLFTMDYKAKADPKAGAKIFYELGIAFYNMSYFGYAWKTMDYFRSGASLSPYWLRDGDNIIPYMDFPYGNKENFDCSQALDYFQKAIQFSVDPELKAKAMYMAAKCERNEYNVKRYSQDTERSYYYFDLIERTAKGTDFYKDVISKCKTFEAYTSK